MKETLHHKLSRGGRKGSAAAKKRAGHLGAAARAKILALEAWTAGHRKRAREFRMKAKAHMLLAGTIL